MANFDHSNLNTAGGGPNNRDLEKLEASLRRTPLHIANDLKIMDEIGKRHQDTPISILDDDDSSITHI